MKNKCAKILVLRAGRVLCPADWRIDTRWETHNLWTVLGGEGRMQAPEQAYDLSAGSCFVLRPQVRYIGSHNPRKPLDVVYIHFEPGKVAVPAFYRIVESLDFFQGMLERLLKAMRNGDKEESATWLAAALTELVEQEQRREFSSGLEPRQRAYLDGFIARVSAQPGKRVSLTALARELCCTPRHLHRLFRQYKGLSPQEFVMGERMRAARNLLNMSSQPISRIAQELGYSDVYAFSKHFKQHVGLPPGRYRQTGGV
jgi:AraC-like DNA-binding protein